MIVILADEVETVLSGIMVEGLYGNDAAAVRKGDGGRFEQALATLLAQFLLIGQREFEDFRPCLPLLERFERLTLARGGDEPINFLAGAIGHAFKAGGKILADLTGHESELPAGGRSWSPGLNFVFMAAILSQTGKTEKPTVGFQARFFLRGCGRRLSLKRNDLQCKKSQKHEKTRKKV
jgi:hypothetical protein